ncbi:MAG: hypothetical protein ABW173_06535 [Sphingomonas sp.]
MRIPFLFAALIALPAMSATARDRPADPLSPIPGARAETCIPLSGIRESRVRDDSTIDFYMRGGRIYRSTLPNACPQLGFEQAFGYGTSLAQLCSTDIITVIRRGGGPVARGASCGLGTFQPMTKTAAKSR